MTPEQWKVLVEFMNDYRKLLEEIKNKLEEIRERQR